MARGRTNFQTSKAFISLLSQKITFLDFKKERRYIIEFSSGLKTDSDGVQSDKTFKRRTKSLLRCREAGPEQSMKSMIEKLIDQSITIDAN